MVGLPATCSSCGLVFVSSAINLGEGTTATMSNNTASCPRCGAMAKMPDGTFTVRNGVLRALTGLQLTPERLADLAAVAQLAHEGAITPEAATQRLEDREPSLADIIASVPTALRKAFIWMLLTALTILASQWVQEARDESATPADVQQAIKRALEQHEQEVPPPPPASAPTGQRRVTKVARNEPCPCGSGKKGKRCCGAAEGGTRYAP